jgi:lipopolysaccharide/colanic/teichoic acid biosynthesis glycosyltransferase
MKRLFDLVAASASLLALSPLMAVIAVLVRHDSPGGALFRQTRVGRHGRPFTIYKFRTMRIDAAGLLITTTSDDRVTKSGRWLRATKLDELPQLWNVARGDMSIVGPRPEVPEYVKQWPTDIRELVLSVRPGITDPASIEFRNESELLARASDAHAEYVSVILPRKLELYESYVRHRTFRGDIIIVLKTIGRILHG